MDNFHNFAIMVYKVHAVRNTDYYQQSYLNHRFDISLI